MRTPITIKELKTKDFIETTLISEIGELIKSNPFISFSLICSGIEFLGRCLDDYNGFDYNYPRQLRYPFDLCIETYMKKYEVLKDTEYDLYKYLRCGFAHQFRPMNKLSLAPVDSNDKDLAELSDGNKVLNIKEFYESFKYACEQVIADIENIKFKHPKMYNTFLKITD